MALQKKFNLKNGFDAEGKGKLFFELARIVKETQPKAFILENVKNLKTHDNGNTFKIIKDKLENELCYNIQYRVINSKHFVPQARQRIFIIGFKEKNDFDFGKLELPNQEFLLKESLDSNDANCKFALSDRRWTTLQKRKEKYNKIYGEAGFIYRIADINKPSRTLCAMYQGNGDILIAQKNKNPRKLSPIECSRIMGFNFKRKKEFKQVVSNSQAYKQYGNVVVPQIIEWIGKEIIKFI